MVDLPRPTTLLRICIGTSSPSKGAPLRMKLFKFSRGNASDYFYAKDTVFLSTNKLIKKVLHSKKLMLTNFIVIIFLISLY